MFTWAAAVFDACSNSFHIKRTSEQAPSLFMYLYALKFDSAQAAEQLIKYDKITIIMKYDNS
eukprot:1148314-Pelagomonas_calceolata.AAC.6